MICRLHLNRRARSSGPPREALIATSNHNFELFVSHTQASYKSVLLQLQKAGLVSRSVTFGPAKLRPHTQPDRDRSRRVARLAAATADYDPRPSFGRSPSVTEDQLVTASVEHHPTDGPGKDAKNKRLPVCYVVAGVSGSGKSTIGAQLAARLGCQFFDGDDFHPAQNVAKMRSGEPLTDSDREPWLRRLAALLKQHAEHGQACVVACSALKRKYRNILSGHANMDAHTDQIAFILLEPSKEELLKRVAARAAEGGHFMPASLLDSQLAALEPDASALIFHSLQADQIVESIVRQREEHLQAASSTS